MTKLERSVKNYLRNADSCCRKAAITVDGNKAETAEQTCCTSFDESKGGKFTNLSKTPEIRLEIACDAVKCVYNEGHRCSAERIDISGDGACGYTETRCSTFKARQIQNQDRMGGDVLRGTGRRPRPFTGDCRRGYKGLEEKHYKKP